MQPAGDGGIAGAGRERVGARRRADAERIADAENQARRAPLVAARPVLERRARWNAHRDLGLQLGLIQARFVDSACFLGDVRADGPLHARRRQAQHRRFRALVARLVQLAVDGLALHHGPVALVGNGEVGPEDRLALAPAFGDSGHRLVAPSLALGDEALNHEDRDEQRQGEQADDERFGGGGEVHGAEPCRANLTRSGQAAGNPRKAHAGLRCRRRSSASRAPFTPAANATRSSVSARMRSMLCRLIACIRRCPMPRCEPNISPSSVPISASENPTRMPVTTSGREAGTSTAHAVAHGESPNARAVRRCVGLMLRTAFIAKIEIGTMPWIAPTATLAGMPMPKMSRITGYRVTSGME